MTRSVHPGLADLLACLLALLLHRILKRRVRQRVPLPPGPKASLLGRVDVPLPSQQPWLTYLRWKKTFGDIVYMGVFGNPIVVLNTKQAAYDLLDRKGSMYSSRPQRPMVTELMGFDWLFSSMQYGTKWRAHRRLFHRHFNSNASTIYRPVQVKETDSLLKSLLENPSSFVQHVRRQNAAIVMMISYGHQIDTKDDHFVSIADQALASMSKAGIFGSFMVDYFPLLKNVPAWVPGAGFKRQAHVWSKAIRAMIDEPFAMVKGRMEDGSHIPSLATCELEILAQEKESFYNEETVKNVSGISYAAGAETSVSVILGFFLAMALFPAIQLKARDELDSVTGGARLPTFEDYDSLPYIRALVFECLRWHPVLPLGVAHRTIKNDVYRGMSIPRDTTVIPNIWAILHDEDSYPQPMEFRPERFLEDSPRGINDYPVECFGFGRRICPGRYLAEATVWISIARILAAFNISKAVNEKGQLIEISEDFTSGLLCRPKPFQCQISPRSEAAKKIVEQLHT